MDIGSRGVRRRAPLGAPFVYSVAVLAAERDSAMTVVANSMSTGDVTDRGPLVNDISGGGKETLREMTNCISTSGATFGPTRSTQRTRSARRSTGYVMIDDPMNPGFG
jgi:hypothetical protein